MPVQRNAIGVPLDRVEALLPPIYSLAVGK